MHTQETTDVFLRGADGGVGNKFEETSMERGTQYPENSSQGGGQSLKPQKREERGPATIGLPSSCCCSLPLAFNNKDTEENCEPWKPQPKIWTNAKNLNLKTWSAMRIILPSPPPPPVPAFSLSSLLSLTHLIEVENALLPSPGQSATPAIFPLLALLPHASPTSFTSLSAHPVPKHSPTGKIKT